MMAALHIGLTRQRWMPAGISCSQRLDWIGALRWTLLPLLSILVCACESRGNSIAESQYASALVGKWQGAVGGEAEAISFREDGSYFSKLQSNGFIGRTLGQGVEGEIGGSWVIAGRVITLTVDSAENERPLNSTTTSTILEFKRNELVVKSAGGETSTFSRVL
jgi:hypothetical protein